MAETAETAEEADTTETAMDRKTILLAIFQKWAGGKTLLGANAGDRNDPGEGGQEGGRGEDVEGEGEMCNGEGQTGRGKRGGVEGWQGPGIGRGMWRGRRGGGDEES